MPKKYVPFIPEPIEGQAVLSNFNRVLKYRGADDISMTLQRGMPLYEMEKTETVGENKDGNLVIHGECVSACAFLKEQGIRIDLVYIDPPFASGADYAKKVFIRRNPRIAETIAAAEQELDIDELKAFEEKMYSDVWSKEKYLNWMYTNLMAIKSVMSETASIYVHLDWHIGHYVKVLMDEIFGEDCFRNEIIWHYYNKMQGNVKRFASNHDTVLWYTLRSDEYLFTPIREERGQTVRQIKRVWDSDYQKLVNAKDEYGRVIYQETDEKTIDDVWRVAMKQPADKKSPIEYATQKPELLLQRIISASSKKGMIVADFFGGSGVTAVEASKLGCRFIHCDVGINSLQTARDKLKASGASFDVLEIKDGVSLYRNPSQTMDKIKSLIPGLKAETSLNSIWAGAISDSKLGTIPVYVPDLKDSSTKLLDVVLMNRIIHQAIPELDGNIKKVIVYYVDITSVEEIESFITNDDSTFVKIELRDLKTILDDVVVADYVELKTEEKSDDLFGGYSVSIEKFVSDQVMQRIDEFNQVASQNVSGKKLITQIQISEDGLELIEFVSLDCTSTDGEWHSDSEVKIDRLGFAIRNGEKTKEFWNGTIHSDQKPLRIKVRNICGDESIFPCG